MRILVDLNRCQSYAQCCFAAPTVFLMHNGEALEYDPAPDDALRELAAVEHWGNVVAQGETAAHNMLSDESSLDV